MHRVYLIVILFISTILISDAYDPLDIDFLKKKSEEKKPEKVEQAAPPVQKKEGLPAFEKVIDGFEEIPGLFTLYWNKEKNKFYANPLYFINFSLCIEYI